MRHAPSKPVRRACSTGAILLTLAACAGPRPPTDALATAELAVRQAETSPAPELAPAELQQARDKLADAGRAAAREDYDGARRLAQQAAVDAEYAEARARAVQTRRNLETVQSSLRALRPTGEVTASPIPAPVTPPGTPR